MQRDYRAYAQTPAGKAARARARARYIAKRKGEGPQQWDYKPLTKALEQWNEKLLAN